MKSYRMIFFVVLLIACLTQVASDIYSPSLPNIAVSLKTNIDLAQWSLAIYMLGVAASQLFYGPLSEGIGRKRPLLAGLLVMLLGTTICFFAPNIHALILGRLIQGCGAGAAASLWRSIVRDVFSGEELSKYISYSIIFIMFIIPSTPILGAYLQSFYGWRASFAFMIIYALVSFVVVFFCYKETNQHHHFDRLKISYILPTYLLLLKSPIFMGITACSFLSYGAFFSWFVTGPILLIKVVGITPVAFGWISFLVGATAYGIAGWLNGRYVKSWGMPKMLRFGWGIMTLASLVLLLNQFFFGQTLVALIAPIFVFQLGSALIWPNAFATAFSPFGKIAGYTGALYGFMQIGGAAAIGGLMSYLPDRTQLPLALVMLGASLCSRLIYDKIPFPANLSRH